MTFEEALAIVDAALAQDHLSDSQEQVFRYAWQEQTYLEMALSTGYDPGYVREVGAKLWQLLSEAFGEKVTKTNLHAVLRRISQQISVQSELDTTDNHANGQRWSAVSGQQTFGVQRPLDPSAPRLTGQGVEPSTPNRINWGEAVDVSVFYGRTEELTTLKQWVVRDRCRLVTLLGLGGIGKTTLAVKLAEQIQNQFEYLIWRSLRNAPPLKDILAELIQFLSDQQETFGHRQPASTILAKTLQTSLPTTIDSQVLCLLEYLREHRCLLVLDNVESILQSGSHAGHYREIYEGYGQLFRCVADASHQSCLVLTSREKPRGLTSKEGDILPVRSLQLMGLGEAEGLEILKVKHLIGSAEERRNLIQCYQGNPLALKMVTATIRGLFDGHISRFLEQGTLVFGDISDLLNKQFDRLSTVEKQIMCWLITNQGQSLLELQEDTVPNGSRGELIEALESLQRRSLIEKNSAGFTQQLIVKEFLNRQLSSLQRSHG